MNYQLKLFLLSFCLICCNGIAAQSLISGTWHGQLSLNSIDLNLVFHFDNDTTCTLDSPDQDATGIKGTVKELTSERVNVVFPLLMAAYEAELKEGQLVGTFLQRGFKLPLTLTPGALVRQRPQTPQPPFPYETHEVKIAVPSPYGGETEGGYTLAGTLTLPPSLGEGTGVGLCLLLVTGSGLQDRDETLFEHKPFAVIADYLARNGIATLRYDDRGFGQSTGDPAQCTTANFADDAAAAIDYLRSLKKFKHIGILGHSEGGSIAFMLGARQLVDAIVALAAPGIQGDTLIVEQSNALLRLRGEQPNMNRKRLHMTMALQPQNPWYTFFTSYDPAADIAATRCPVLALNGSLDIQVLPESNLSAIKKLSTLNSKLSTKLYPSLNHLFQHATTGAPTEYGVIEETISEEVLSDIVTWLQGLEW